MSQRTPSFLRAVSYHLQTMDQFGLKEKRSASPNCRFDLLSALFGSCSASSFPKGRLAATLPLGYQLYNGFAWKSGLEVSEVVSWPFARSVVRVFGICFRTFLHTLLTIRGDSTRGIPIRSRLFQSLGGVQWSRESTLSCQCAIQ